MKTNLFEIANFKKETQKKTDLNKEIEKRVHVKKQEKKRQITYKERFIALNQRNILVCELVKLQGKNGKIPIDKTQVVLTTMKKIKRLNRKYLRDNAYWKQNDNDWKDMLNQWVEKESQLKSKDMNDLYTLIDEKKKAVKAYKYNMQLGEIEKCKKIRLHIEWLQDKIENVPMQSVITKKGSKKYYTKKTFNI